LKKRYMTATVIAGLGTVLAFSAPAAQAANVGDLVGSGGVGFIGSDPYTQWCQPEFVQSPVGLGSPGGATIEVEAVGEVTGTDVLATRITCNIIQDSRVVLALDSGFQRDNFAETTGSFVEKNTDPLTKCVQVTYFNGAVNATAAPACTPVS
jgi:hypothetical protein